MPDQAGRPTLYDWMAVARGWTDVQKQTKEAQSEEKTNEYGKIYAEGKEPDRAAEDYHFAADLKAQTSYFQNQANRITLDNARREEGQRVIDETIPKAEQLLAAGDVKGFWNTVTPLYNQYVPDGNKITGLTEDGKLLVVTPDGKQTTQPAPDPKQALQMARGLSKNYQKMDQEWRMKVRELNVKNIQAPDGWVDSKGDLAFHIAIIDPHDGTIKETLTSASGEFLGGFDASTGQVVPPKSDYKPIDFREYEQKTKKGEVDIRHTGVSTEEIKSRTDIAKEKAPLERAEIQARTGKLKAEATGVGKKETEKEQKQYKADLEIMLKPFAANNAYDPAGNLRPEGAMTALGVAQRLVGKYRRKEKLTPTEKANVQQALRVVDMYNKMSGDVYGRYNKQSGLNWRDFE
jgi:hypothetical protein